RLGGRRLLILSGFYLSRFTIHPSQGTRGRALYGLGVFLSYHKERIEEVIGEDFHGAKGILLGFYEVIQRYAAFPYQPSQ
ncbi:MAG: hypothetical protein Q8K68_04460, partial [Nitrospirota bacterium]|nr:hypothetical protein [Nitrospirota bacterium]